MSATALAADAIRATADRIAPYVRRTPILEVDGADFGLEGVRLVFKLELLQHAGSFKTRGAFNNLLTRELPAAGVVAASGGNHGAAVAYAAQKLGLKATIFLPEKNNPVKRARIAALRAAIVETGSGDLAAAWKAAEEYSQTTGAYFLNDATDPALPAGPGTIGCEILEQAPDARAVYVPMGDTALIRGVAAAIKQQKPSVKVIGVQAATAPSYFLSWKSGAATETESCDTIADGLATRTPDANNVRAIRELVDDVVLVSDDEMLRAIAFLSAQEQLIAEPAGAAATAALLQRKSGNGENAVALITGANIQEDILERAMYVAA